MEKVLYLQREKRTNAEVAQLVEHDLAKVGVAGPSPVFRSNPEDVRSLSGFFSLKQAQVVELVDTKDLKSFGRKAVRVQVPPRVPQAFSNRCDC